MDLQVVCPESSEFDGQAAYVALPATTGEMGVLPRHASEICTLRPGYVRISEQRMGTTDRVIAVDEGYAEITADRVIILTERAQAGIPLRAYEDLKAISFDGAFHRKDIGRKALEEENGKKAFR